MSIIQSVPETINGITLNRLTSENDFYVCVYTEDKVINFFSTDNAIKKDYVLRSLLNVFGADTYEELIEEINRLNLISL